MRVPTAHLMPNIPNIPRLFVKSETLEGFKRNRTRTKSLSLPLSPAVFSLSHHEFIFCNCSVLVRVTVVPEDAAKEIMHMFTQEGNWRNC